MVTYKSNGGRGTTKVEERWQVLRPLLIFLVVLAAGIYGAIYFQNHKPSPKPAPQDVACAQVIQNSVFTTGSPLIDQRILWVILNDKSANKDTAGGIVRHIWETGEFKFEKAEEKQLWDAAVGKVQTINSPIDKPALSITSDGTITPFTEPAEAKNLSWTEVNVTNMPAQRSTFLMTSTLGEQKSNPVPVVLLSINGASTVPAPTLGLTAEYAAINTKEVCK